MTGTRWAAAFCSVSLLALPTAPAGSAPAKDSWSGFITLDWSTKLPDDSPLRAMADRVVVDAHKKWTMMVHFERSASVGRVVKYEVRTATVDYLETWRQEALQRGDEGSMRVLETRQLQAEARKLDSRACNLELWVNYAVKKYWIEVGGFELSDVPESGQILIEITDSNGTRRSSGPRTGDDNVIEPVYFEGRFTGARPTVLEGTFDANVEPPPGVDLTHQTVGGLVEWRLFREGCPELVDACKNNAEIGLSACMMAAQGGFQIECPDLRSDCLDDLDIEPLTDDDAFRLTLRECFQVNCWKVEEHQFEHPDVEDGIDALMECFDQYYAELEACEDLCP